MNEYDVSKLPLIGEGSHGKVYKLDDKRCLKVCRNPKHIQLEYQVLKHGERFPQFARVYECKDNYMVREFFDGPNAREYIAKHGLSKGLAVQLVEILDIFKELGFTRWDCSLSHIIVTEGEILRIIDPTRGMDKLGDYPRKMLHGLESLGYKKAFLAVVKELRPQYYAEWSKK